MTAAAIAVCPVAIAALEAPAARADETVRACGLDAGGVDRVFGPSFVEGIATTEQCPAAGMKLYTTGAVVGHGQSAHWEADAPTGLSIVLAEIPPYGLAASHVNTGQGYGGGLYWAGGYQNLTDAQNGTGTVARGFSSGYVGFYLVCESSPCTGQPASLAVKDIGLQVHETSGPYLTAGAGLWQAQGFVRGDWPLSFNGDSPSGVCYLTASVNGQTLGARTFAGDNTVFHQCAATGLSATVHTTQYPNGADSLALYGNDAAALAAQGGSYTKAVYFDNQQPTVALSGPSDAPSTAGTQYLTATASAGPSGVSGISCDVDGAYQAYAGASAEIPIAGVGVHNVTCTAANNSRSTSLAVGVSAPVSQTISIRQPTVFGLGFTRVKNALRCGPARVRVRVRGRLVTVRRHHKLVHVRQRGHTKTLVAKRCHPRIEIRRVPVFTTVNGHRVKHFKRVRVVVLPHMVTSATRHIAYGHSSTLSGVLLANDGAPLSGQTVQVLSAPDDGQGHFTRAASASTHANGDWSATLPAGPSRLVEAFYAGGTLTEPSISAQARVVVPARVRLLSVTPRRIPARGGTVQIVGQLDGGYLPAAGALVQLQIGVGKYVSTYGVKSHVTGDGRFSTAYTFGPAHHAFFFELKSLPAGDYPYAPSRSGRVSVIVGG